MAVEHDKWTREALRLERSEKISRSEAFSKVAVKYGFKNWQEVVDAKRKEEEPVQLGITDFDGFNVHDPDNYHRFTVFDTMAQAEDFLKSVQENGFVKANELLKSGEV